MSPLTNSVFSSERIAFTAGMPGESVAVYRATEGHPGLLIDPEFGYFETWTQANEFARRLNEGLGLTATDANYIVFGAILEDATEAS